MKLFVWNNPYRIQFGGSMVFAVAETLDAAKAEAAKGVECSYGTPNTSGMTGTGSGVRGIPLGDPDRILDLPCAEWHAWSE